MARLVIKARYKSRTQCPSRDRSTQLYEEKWCDKCKAWHIEKL